MAKFTLTHTIDCDADAFWKLFFDSELNAKLFKEGLGFARYEVVEQHETDREIRRKILAEPSMKLPGPVQKAIGSSFSYTEDGTFDKATKTWRWKMTPNALSEKTKMEGTLTVEPLGEGKVRRKVELLVEAKVFMIGGLIEDTFEKQLRDGWEKSAAIQNEYIREQPKG